MAYNLTDEDLESLSVEQLLELSSATIEMSRRLDAEMLRRGLVTAAEVAENARRGLERVGRVRADLQQVARSGSWDDKRQFLLIQVDDELQLLEHMLGEEAGV